MEMSRLGRGRICVQKRKGSKRRDVWPGASGGAAIPRRRDLHIPQISVCVANREFILPISSLYHKGLNLRIRIIGQRDGVQGNPVWALCQRPTPPGNNTGGGVKKGSSG